MIRFLDLQKVNAMHGDELREALGRVAQSGWYLLGEEVKSFEQSYASFIGTDHCVAVGNGLDALTLIYRAYIEMGLMHEGDEVIVPANTFIASILAITENRLVPVLVEPRADRAAHHPAHALGDDSPPVRSLCLYREGGGYLPQTWSAAGRGQCPGSRLSL